MISGKDIKGAINYNELKVMEGKATILQACGFLKEPCDLSFYDKLNRFADLNERNQRAKTNTLHISLNFDPSEKLNEDELRNISSTYMEKIGFGDQPYLVYEHKDAAHQHVHIVTTLIREGGSRLPIHYLGKNESEKARKEIEIEYGLVKADGKKKAETIHPVNVQKVIYGKSETKRGISNVVRSVTRSYKYTSLPELNAALRQFNVVADRGTENSKMFEKRGLIYSLLDEHGKRIGIPIKASSIYTKPTLTFLEKQFKLNETLRLRNREPLKKIIDRVLKAPVILTLEQFRTALEKRGVATIFRMNSEGRNYGITFVDNNSRVVFNGSALGKSYSVNAIEEFLSVKRDTVKPFRPGYTELKTKETRSTPKSEERDPKNSAVSTVSENTPDKTSESDSLAVIKDLISAEAIDPTSPESALRLRKKRRRRKGKRL